jgi:hypothetical protein
MWFDTTDMTSDYMQTSQLCREVKSEIGDVDDMHLCKRPGVWNGISYIMRVGVF